VKCTFIHEHCDRFEVEVMCGVCDVARAGCYAWLNHDMGPRAQCASAGVGGRSSGTSR
jgi:hypothetical protein